MPDLSAIAAMLREMNPQIQQTGGGGMPGGPMPAALSSQMPQMGQPPMAQPPSQSMVGRIHDRLSGILGSVSDAARPGAPGGYGGLLSDEEIKSARPSFLQSIIGAPDGPSSSERYRGNLDSIVKMKSYAADLAAQKQHAGLRKEVGALLGNTDMDPHARFAALTKMMGVAYANGDEKSLGAIANALQTAKPSDMAKPHEYEPKAFTMKDGSLAWVKPGEPIPAGAKPFREAPQQGEDRTLVQVEGPDGPIWVPRAQAAGMSVKKSGAAGTAQNAANEALLRASVGEMHNADSFMREYENDLASGKKSINGLAQFMGGLGNSFTHDDPGSRAIQNSALTALNKLNPDLARYIRRGLSFAEGEAGISKRPSDFRTKMATFLSTAASGASPEMIQDIQGRRASILTPLHDVVSKMVNPKGSGSESGTKPKTSLDAYRHLLK